MPLIDGFDEESILSVGHLGIVAGAYDSLGIGNIIDTAIPKTRNHNLTHSQAVKAMVLKGLGFIERRLYLFPEFFDDIAVERLLGEGITREQINDDVLGRTLDAIAEYGPTELFNEIVANCLLPMEFGSHCVHVDTTNFSVTGEYESDFNTEEIQITYGHPKDGRWDLKRFVLGMASNQHGVPLFLQTFSGVTGTVKIPNYGKIKFLNCKTSVSFRNLGYLNDKLRGFSHDSRHCQRSRTDTRADKCQ